MFCFNCGKELPEEARFCAYCGTALEEFKKSLANLQDDAVDAKLKSLAFNTTSSISNIQEAIATLAEKEPTASTGCDCAEKIAALEAKVAALEGFVQALQADGYLTLANIKKAAADACPICTHTHEEEQSAE
jgi:hypothetical protein